MTEVVIKDKKVKKVKSKVSKDKEEKSILDSEITQVKYFFLLGHFLKKEIVQ